MAAVPYHMSDDDFLLLIGGTVLYAVITVIFVSIAGVPNFSSFDGSFAGIAPLVATVWLAIGAMLVVADIAVLFGSVSAQ